MPRKGKIARLPRHVRHEVNLKLGENVQTKEILACPNELPETMAPEPEEEFPKRKKRGNPPASPTQSNRVKPF